MARYRDSLTGRFVSETTWKRSKARGGKRYKRERKRKRTHAGSIVEIGYAGSRENSYTLRILIHPYKNLSDRDLISLVEELIKQGHFDDSPENPHGDFAWVFANYAEVVERNVTTISRGHAVLLEFDRREPGGLP